MKNSVLQQVNGPAIYISHNGTVLGDTRNELSKHERQGANSNANC
jgi:hypothetical protein